MSEDLTASAPPQAVDKIINNKRAQVPSTCMSLLDPPLVYSGIITIDELLSKFRNFFSIPAELTSKFYRY